MSRNRASLPQKLRTFLTVGQAAYFLGVSSSTLRNWERSGKLKAKRHPVNGYRLYDRDELLELLRRVGTDEE